MVSIIASLSTFQPRDPIHSLYRLFNDKFLSEMDDPWSHKALDWRAIDPSGEMLTVSPSEGALPRRHAKQPLL